MGGAGPGWVRLRQIIARAGSRGVNGTVGERLLQLYLGASNEQSDVTKQRVRDHRSPPIAHDLPNVTCDSARGHGDLAGGQR